jgi:hypothetical protein
MVKITYHFRCIHLKAELANYLYMIAIVKVIQFAYESTQYYGSDQDNIVT